jgi:hypothetical protein
LNWLLLFFREQTSQTSSDEANKKRMLPSESSTERKASGRKPDILFSHRTFELGAMEYAKSIDYYNNKHFYDSKVKLPTLLKGVLIKLLESCSPSSQQDLSTVELVTSGKYIKY